MATPTNNYIPQTKVNLDLTGAARPLLFGIKWGTKVGEGVPLTFSFPSLKPSYVAGYEDFGTFQALNHAERTVIRDVLKQWTAVANVRFKEVADTATSVGELRFGITSNPAASDAAAYAYVPYGGSAVDGDVWFVARQWNPTRSTDANQLRPGTLAYFVALHETGHALGLKHPFEASQANSATLPQNLDSFFHTVMSYSAKPGVAPHAGLAFYPTTPMYYDLLAMQHLYGRSTSHNSGNNTYTFVDGQYYWQTIYDAGGVDTIVFQGNTASTINLNIGSFSELSRAIAFGDGTSSRATVAIGPSTIIENATGGGGNDVITGNAVANVLAGMGGNDTIYGGIGNDTLIGGNGNDWLEGGAGLDRIDGGAGTDTASYQSSTAGVRVSLATSTGHSGDALGDVLVAIENLFGSSHVDHLTGSAAANSIWGGAGNDTIIGGGGNDWLHGGLGNDAFVFNAALSAASNVDTIADFVVRQDRFHIDDAVFRTVGAPGALSAGAFALGAAADAGDRILYSQATGVVSYDADGTGGVAAVAFARVTPGLALSAADFLVI